MHVGATFVPATCLPCSNQISAFAVVTPILGKVEISEKREGEEWVKEESGANAGKFILKSCYKGSLLVNTTLETQECKVKPRLNCNHSQFFVIILTSDRILTVMNGVVGQECEENTFSISFLAGCTAPADRPTADWEGGCDNRHVNLLVLCVVPRNVCPADFTNMTLCAGSVLRARMAPSAIKVSSCNFLDAMS